MTDLSSLLLKKGDLIGVMAPSGRFRQELLDQGVQTLSSMGFRVRVPQGLDGVHRYLAGDDAARRHGLHEMYRDPEVKAVMAARGGYGSMRLLEQVDWALLAAHPKLMIGFSDVTALLSALVDRGHCVIHGPNLVSMADPDPFTRDRFYKALTQQPSRLVADTCHTLRNGRAEGRLVGGNLATLAHLVGTRFQPDFSNALLFVEDIGEPAYKIDRMLTQMRMAGLLDGVRGVVAGEFVNCENSEYIPEILLELFPGIPVMAGLPAGHGSLNAALMMGEKVVMDGRGLYWEASDPLHGGDGP